MVDAIPAYALLHESPVHLVDARRTLAASHVRLSLHLLFFVWAFSQIGAFFALWATGNAARLRDALRRALRDLTAVRFAYGAALTLLSAAAAFPAAFVRYRVDYIFGLTPEYAATWFRDGATNAGIHAIVVGALVAAILALVDRTRYWYAIATGGLFVVTLAMAFAEPLVIAPLYDHFTPLAHGSALRAPLERLAVRAGVPNAPIVVSDASRRSNAAVADVAGFGPTTRIVLSDNVLENATPAEVEFLTAREFGHYVHGDDFRLSILWTALFVACTALAVVLADRTGVRRDDDPLSRLPLVFAFLGTLALVATPFYNWYSRSIERRADVYALELTGDRVGAARAFVRLADETLAPLCASRPVVWYFSNSPELGSRIARAVGEPDPCR